MDATKQHVVDRLLQELKAGNREAFAELLPLVYGELHNVAARQRQNWDGGETLNTTALIHEAYIRLADQSAPDGRVRLRVDHAQAVNDFREASSSSSVSELSQQRTVAPILESLWSPE